MSRVLVLFMFVGTLFIVNAQQCSLSLLGSVIQDQNGEQLSDCYICIKGGQNCCISNEEGKFCLKDLCEGAYHIEVSHLGCKTYSQYIELKEDTVLNISLKHQASTLNEAIIHGGKVHAIQENETLDQEQVVQNSNKTLGEFLEHVTGVSALKNGGGVSKPVIHGLTGNRVGYIVDGASLTSQQWGNDHMPEIDMFAADHVTVVKGVSTLEYNAPSVTALVVFEPHELKREPHLHGGLHYNYDTNSRGNTVNLRLSKYEDRVAAINAIMTYKRFGDFQSPNYFLTNTGGEQYSSKLQLQRKLGRKLKANFTTSYFQNQIGSLSGAFNDSGTSLTNALNRSVPAGTNSYFSYDFEAPYQSVKHRTLQLDAVYKFSQLSRLVFSYNNQRNQRKEYDRRRSNRTRLPALDLDKRTAYYKLTYALKTSKNNELKVGGQSTQTQNTNVSGTLTYPLYPHYNADDFGVFVTYKNRSGSYKYDIGARLSGHLHNATKSVRVIENFQRNFINPSFATSISRKYKKLALSLSTGITNRPPDISELYIEGLHQGVASLEFGNPNLVSETSFKSTFKLEYTPSNKFSIQSLFYYNPISDYIYLISDGTSNSPRGSFPVFRYRQTNALLYGLDFSVIYSPIHQLSLQLKGAYLRGHDQSNDIALPFMSPNNASLGITYALGDRKCFKNTQFNASLKRVMQQNHFSLLTEFIPPPPAYTLVGFRLKSSLNFINRDFDVSLGVENLFDVSYRDYLNRMRYFSDELGRNISVRLGYQF